MAQYFAEYGLKPALCEDFLSCSQHDGHLLLGVAPLAHGFILESEIPSAFVTETELYATTVRTRSRDSGRRSQVDGMLRDLSEVKVGDPVVHADHGIGRYLGLVSMDLGEGETEFLLLQYAGVLRLTRLRYPSWAAANGKKPSAVPCSRHAIPPLNY
jgi:transcription-repair coupling factor (superfamily II helicase)